MAETDDLNGAPQAIPVRSFSESRFLSDRAIWDFILATQQDHPVQNSIGESPAGCPAPHRLALGSALFWTDDELAHVEGCELCQNTLSLAWRTECPSIESLFGFLAAPDSFSFGGAMMLHLGRDACPRCARLLDLPALDLVASALRSYRRLLPVVFGRVVGAARALGAGAMTARGLGLPARWLGAPPQWLSPQLVTMGAELSETEAELTPFAVLESGLQGVLFEVEKTGELRAVFSGIGRDREPPGCALISENPTSENGEEVSVAFPQWSEPDSCWECHWNTTPERFRVVLVPRPAEPSGEQS